jgi:hypothetical protein
MGGPEEQLSAIGAAVTKAADLIRIRMREAKRAELALRATTTMSGAEYKVVDAIERLRADAEALRDRQLRAAEAMAGEQLTSESGMQRALAQRLSTQWITWIRAAFAEGAAMSATANRALAEVVLERFREVLRGSVQSASAELLTMQQIDLQLQEIQFLVTDLETDVRRLIAEGRERRPPR